MALLSLVDINPKTVIPNQLRNMNQAERDRLRTCYKMSQEALVTIAQDSKSVDPK